MSGERKTIGGAAPGRIGDALVREVMRALGALHGVTIWRNAVMSAVTKSGQQLLTGLGGKGAPDLIAEVQVGSVSAMVWLECKAGAGELNADQVRWHEAARLTGRHVFVVRSAQDALDAVCEVRAMAACGGMRA